MATTVTGLTKERMVAMEAATIIDGNVIGNNLHLTTRGGTDINAGNVRGPIGPAGTGYTICTSTTRPTGLVAADEGLAIFETDTGLVRSWTGSRWKVQEYIICTSTTRPAMTAADNGTVIHETNTGLKYTWTSTRWKLQERIICTSTTRPTGLTTLDDGVAIYETDTNEQYVWADIAWMSAKEGMEHILFESIRTSNSGSIGTTDTEIPATFATINVKAGRQYTVKYGCRIDTSVDNLYLVFKLGNDFPATVLYGEAHFWIDKNLYPQRCEFMFPITIPTGSQEIHLSAHVDTRTPGSFILSAATGYPGYYQILERY